MPRGRVKTKGDEKLWRKAKQTANARAKDDSSFKKDSDEYWAFVNSQFDKFRSGELKIREQGAKSAGAMNQARRIFKDMVSGKVSTYADLMQFHGLAKDEADAVYRVAASSLDKPDAVNQIANAIRYGLRRESTMKVAERLIERELRLMELSQLELVDTGQYTEPDREHPRIKTSGRTVTWGEPDEFGDADYTDEDYWIDEEGVEIWPNEWDKEEGLGVAELAADWLADRGHLETSDGETFYTADWHQDMRTGAAESEAYRLSGFTTDELNRIGDILDAKGLLSY